MRLTHKLHQYIEHMWWQKKKPFVLLRGLSYLYQLCSKYEQNQRLKKSSKAPLPLISIGNITVGGSGKTPFTIWLAQQLKTHGFKPVILCRGDGAKHTQTTLLNHHSQANDVGDEAVLLYKMSLCPVISGHDRVQASTIAAKHGNIILLDDGFQYRQLQRNCDIILIPDDGLGNNHLLPAGPLRESSQALARADIIIRTGNSPKQAVSQKKEWLWQTFPQPLKDWNQCKQTPPLSIVAVSGIARPQRFRQSLISLGLDVTECIFFPDHHAFTIHDMQPLWQEDKAIAVTAKDAVKLLPIWPKNRALWVLEQGFHGENGLFEMILDTLDVGANTSQC